MDELFPHVDNVKQAPVFIQKMAELKKYVSSASLDLLAQDVKLSAFQCAYIFPWTPFDLSIVLGECEERSEDRPSETRAHHVFYLVINKKNILAALIDHSFVLSSGKDGTFAYKNKNKNQFYLENYSNAGSIVVITLNLHEIVEQCVPKVPEISYLPGIIDLHSIQKTKKKKEWATN